MKGEEEEMNNRRRNGRGTEDGKGTAVRGGGMEQ